MARSNLHKYFKQFSGVDLKLWGKVEAVVVGQCPDNDEYLWNFKT